MIQNETREDLAIEIYQFQQFVQEKAVSLSIVDFFYWRHAVEVILSNATKQLYDRYERQDRVVAPH
jgi:hypothetical protein